MVNPRRKKTGLYNQSSYPWYTNQNWRQKNPLQMASERRLAKTTQAKDTRDKLQTVFQKVTLNFFAEREKSRASHIAPQGFHNPNETHPVQGEAVPSPRWCLFSNLTYTTIACCPSLKKNGGNKHWWNRNIFLEKQILLERSQLAVTWTWLRGMLHPTRSVSFPRSHKPHEN